MRGVAHRATETAPSTIYRRLPYRFFGGRNAHCFVRTDIYKAKAFSTFKPSDSGTALVLIWDRLRKNVCPLLTGAHPLHRLGAFFGRDVSEPQLR